MVKSGIKLLSDFGICLYFTGLFIVQGILCYLESPAIHAALFGENYIIY